MWPSVLPALKPALHDEGFTDFMYLDQSTPGLVTVGIGNKIDPVEDALKLEWVDSASGQLASPSVVVTAWQAIKSSDPGMQKGGGIAYAPLSTLRLTPDSLARVMAQTVDTLDLMWRLRLPCPNGRPKFDTDQGYTETYSSDYRQFPADVQLALLRWAWANGFKVFPKMFRALDAQDFLTAYAQSHWSNEQPETDALLSLLFANGAASVGQGLDPSVLIWPGSATSAQVSSVTPAVPNVSGDPPEAGDTETHTLAEANNLFQNYEPAITKLGTFFDALKDRWMDSDSSEAASFAIDLGMLEGRWKKAKDFAGGARWAAGSLRDTSFAALLMAILKGGKENTEKAIAADDVYRAYLGAVKQGSLEKASDGNYVGDLAKVVKGDFNDLRDRLVHAETRFNLPLYSPSPPVQPPQSLGQELLQKTNVVPTPYDFAHYASLFAVAVAAGLTLYGINTLLAAKRELGSSR